MNKTATFALTALAVAVCAQSWPLAAFFAWFCLSSAILHGLTGESIPRHSTDVTPDYPGGLAGWCFLASNVAVGFACLNWWKG
jgi:hypothetical protein